MNLTLGFSTCPNDTFIFDALVHGRIDTGGLSFQLHLADVEDLNQIAVHQKLDITKLSYRAYLDVADHYYLLRSGGALGLGCGPLLISGKNQKDSSVKDMTIAVPGEKTTANFLLDFAFRDVARKVYLKFSEIEDAVLSGKVDAGVIIHENRFTYQEKGLSCLADLGEIWEKQTGAPIPLGCIACKRALGKQKALHIERLIRESILYAFNHPEKSRPFVANHATTMTPEVMHAHIDLYVNDFSVDIGEEGLLAIQTLRQHCSGEIDDSISFFP